MHFYWRPAALGVTLAIGLAASACVAPAPTTNVAPLGEGNAPPAATPAPGGTTLPSWWTSGNALPPAATAPVAPPTQATTNPVVTSASEAPVLGPPVPPVTVAAATLSGGPELPKVTNPRAEGTDSTLPAPIFTTGTTFNGRPNATFVAPTWNLIKAFGDRAIIRIFDADTVVVAEDTKIYRTADAGVNWQVFESVGGQVITSLLLKDATHGWVGGDKGSLAEFTVEGTSLTYQLRASGTSTPIREIWFHADGRTGLIVDEANNRLRRTGDGGVTWRALSINLSGNRSPLAAGATSSFHDDMLGGVIYAPANIKGGPFEYSPLFRLAVPTPTPIPATPVPGATATPIPLATPEFNFTETPVTLNGDTTFSGVTVGYPATGWAPLTLPTPSIAPFVPVTYLKNGRVGASTWYMVTANQGWVASGTVSTDMVTATTVLKDGLLALYAMAPQTLLARITTGEYAISEDGGLLWSEPVAFSQSLDWVKPFSTTRMWGVQGTKLYRGDGTP